MRVTILLGVGIVAVISVAPLCVYAANEKQCAGCDSVSISVRSNASGKVIGRALENVSIKNFSYITNEITVFLGDTVTWKNNDSVAHSSTSTTAIWDSGQLAGGESYSFTFSQLGEFPYYCSLHHDMRGKVIVVPLPAPVINSPTTVTATVGAPFKYQIAGSFNPTSFNAANLPIGLSIDQTSGVISGMPVAPETARAVTLSATNATGTGQANLALTVVLPPAPVVNGTGFQGVIGVQLNYQIVASNNPVLYEAENLPANLTVNATTGLISGTPTSEETARPITLRAINAGGTGTVVVFLSTQLPAAPAVNTSGTVFAQAGEVFSFQVLASNNPTSFASTDLPAGLSIQTTGLIQGIPSRQGMFLATISAANAGGLGTGILKFEIAPPTPIVLSSVLMVDALLEVPFSYSIPASGNAPLTYQAQGLPAGLLLNQNKIEGTPLETGVHSVTLTVSNPYVVATSVLSIKISDPQTTGDTDGDGFSDPLELSLGSSPLDGGSTPAGIVAGASAPLDIERLQIFLNFRKTNSDSVLVAGQIVSAADFKPAQQTVVLDAGGLIHVLPLDVRGRNIAKDRQFKLSASRKGDASLIFQFKASRGAFSAFFSNEGFVADTRIRNEVRNVTVSLLVGGHRYSVTRSTRYTATPDRRGTAR